MENFKALEHQQKAIDIAKNTNEYGLFFEQGTGKTFTTIQILRNIFNTHRKIIPTVIICPKSMIYSWKKEFEKFSSVPTDYVVVLSGSSTDKLSKINGNKIYIINIDSFSRKQFLDAFLAKVVPYILVLDECHLCKNPTASRSKNIFEIAKKTSYRYILSGTPILNSLMDVFMQFKILDLGKTFGTNYFMFRAKYFIDKNAGFANKAWYFPDFVPNPLLYDDITNKIYQKSSRVLKKDCLDLPPEVEETLYVELTPDQKKAYNDMKRDFLTYVNGTACIASIALTKALRLQQIVCGHIVNDQGEVIEIDASTRIEALSGVLQNIVGRHKVIIWYKFKYDRVILSRLLKELKIKFCEINGEQGSERENEIVKFQNEPEYSVMLSSIDAGGTGITLTAADYRTYWSRDFSLGHYEQSRARNHRKGSEIHESITEINICAKNTIDETLTDALLSKQDLAKRILDVVKNEVQHD